MTARPAPGVALCRLDELEDPGTKGFRFRVGDDIFAGFVLRMGDRAIGYVDFCPHAGWPLAFLGDLYLTRGKDRLLCSGHGALFRLEDGVCTAGPCVGEPLKPWPVEVLEGVVTTA